MKQPYRLVVIECESAVQAQQYAMLADQLAALLGCEKVRFRVHGVAAHEPIQSGSSVPVTDARSTITRYHDL